jgi:hypothetical protein
MNSLHPSDVFYARSLFVNQPYPEMEGSDPGTTRKCVFVYCCFIQILMVENTFVNKLKIHQEAGTIFTTLHFLHNLQMFQISWSVSLLEAGMACQGQTLAYWAKT